MLFELSADPPPQRHHPTLTRSTRDIGNGHQTWRGPSHRLGLLVFGELMCTRVHFSRSTLCPMNFHNWPQTTQRLKWIYLSKWSMQLQTLTNFNSPPSRPCSWDVRKSVPRIWRRFWADLSFQTTWKCRREWFVDLSNPMAVTVWFHCTCEVFWNWKNIWWKLIRRWLQSVMFATPSFFMATIAIIIINVVSHCIVPAFDPINVQSANPYGRESPHLNNLPHHIACWLWK